MTRAKGEPLGSEKHIKYLSMLLTNVMSAYTGTGHSAVNSDELLKVLVLAREWVETGQRGRAEDKSRRCIGQVKEFAFSFKCRGF